jgi:hypothetical protein
VSPQSHKHSAMDKATKAWSMVVRARDRYCQSCGKPGVPNSQGLPIGGLDAAHIFTRNHFPTRVDERNGVALCRPCAMDFTEHPARWRTWARDHVGQELFDELQALSNSLDRPDWTAEVARLRRRLDHLRSAA